MIALATVVFGLLSVVGGLGSTSAQAGRDDGLDDVGTYTYTVDPLAAEIDVEAVIGLTANRPDGREGNRIYQYYFDAYGVLIPESASDVSVDDGIGPVPVRRIKAEVPGFEIALIDLRYNLFRGQSVKLTMNYTLTNSLYREAEEPLLPVVVNEASVGFFVGDNWHDSWAITLDVPDDFELVDDPYDPAPFVAAGPAEDGAVSLTADGAGEGRLYYVLFENPDAMVARTLEAAGTNIVVEHWPGDTEWVEQVEAEIDDHLVDLTQLVATPWPNDEIVIQESAVPATMGYGGWYDSEDSTIVMGPWIDDLTVMHEFSHVWIGYHTMVDTWVVEGLASEMAALASAPSGDWSKAVVAPPVSLDDEVARPLADWLSADSDVELWEYSAAWQLMTELRRRSGDEAFLEAVRSAIGGANPYDPSRASEPPDAATDRRRAAPAYRFLDYYEEAAPEAAGADELVAEWVDGGWNEQYDERRRARMAHDQLVESGQRWEPPAFVNEAIARWRFGTAIHRIDLADDVLAQRDRADSRLEPLQLEVPDVLGEAYEQAESAADLIEVTGELNTATDEILAVDALDDNLDDLERLGLVGTGFDHERQLAKAHFATGNFDGMEAAAARAGKTVDDARRRAAIILAVVVGALVTTVGATAFTVRRRRRPSGFGR